MAAGYRVVAIGGSAPGFDERLRGEGIELVTVPLQARSTGPLQELRTFLTLLRLLRRLRPDVLHTFTIKPTIYGRLAARWARLPAVVSTVTGLGHIFIADGARARLLQALVACAYRAAFGHHNSMVIFQNPEDRAEFERARLLGCSESELIRGSGIDLVRFAPVPEPPGPPVVLMVARLIWEKGLGEFVEAARIVRRRRPDVRFVIVGDDDLENPNGVPRAVREGWATEGCVELWGYRDDLPSVYAQAAIVCLPSYREGVPKTLLEAAACARAMVATDVPGCREVVIDGVTGLLVPARDAPALALAVQRLLAEPGTRRRLAAAARDLAAREFDVRFVTARTLSLRGPAGSRARR
jgi:glycosyltransferase involved in cell wall biosynthesis